MGTCYSKTGQEIDQDSEKRPKERRKGSQKNGHSKSLKNPRLVIDIPIQRDLSDTVYTEDSHFCIADEANCINKSMQTSLNNLNRDANKNIEALTGCEIMEQSDCVVINDKSKWKSNNTPSAQDVQKEIVKNLELRDGKVSTSDSGIVVEGCKSCEGVEENSEVNDKCPENLETRMDSFDQACENCGCESEEPEHTGNAKCSCNHTNTTYCDSHRHSVLTEHSNSCSCHGECQGHLFSESSRSYHVNTSSENLILKSSLKKDNSERSRRKKGLSWKSADSLDYLESMAISLDRTKSVCSSILGDDISLFNAPLATFDSVDFALGSSYDFSKRFGESLKNQVGYCSDTLQFQFDFSGLEGDNRESVASIDRLSESYKRTESPADLDKIRLAIRQNSLGTPTEHR